MLVCRVAILALIQAIFVMVLFDTAKAGPRTLDEVLKDSSAWVEYVKKVAVFEKYHLESVERLVDLGSGAGNKINCQAAVAYGVVMYMNELVNMAIISADTYNIASVIAWKKNEDMHA